MTADDPRPAGEVYSDGITLWGPVVTGCCYGQGPHRHGVSSNTRPAASGGATDGERECARCGQSPESHAYPGSPAYECVYVFPPAPVASQADGELRARAEQLWHDLINEDDQGAVDKLIPLLADAAKVQRVRELHQEESGQWCTYCGAISEGDSDALWPCRTIRALDGTR